MISVCVTTIRPHTIRYLIASLKQQEFSQWELVIAVQGENPELKAVLEEESRSDPRILCLYLEPKGKSYALNIATQHASYPLLAFTDDDCEADSLWLQKIYQCFATDSITGIVAGDLRPPRNEGVPSLLSVCPQTYTKECQYDPSREGKKWPDGFYWGGANFAIRKELYEKMGGFDEAIGPGTSYPGAEDTDFAYRATLMGIKIWTTPQIIIYHTFGRRNGIRACLHHFRNYALGSGAFLGKVYLVKNNGQLSETPRNRASFSYVIEELLKFNNLRKQGPKTYLVNAYRRPFVEIAKRGYLSMYSIDKRVLSVPLSEFRSLPHNKPHSSLTSE